ncbi:MAG TPA: APC family permease [Gemmatimonadaceae bacterium]|nr:APC family permease [Gemmatimonadaceae bacterium]
MTSTVETPASAVAPAHRGRLLNVLGVAFGLAVIIGNTIGMGILRTPGEIAARLPSPSLFLLVWVVGGCYALLGAISLSELGAMIPRSGGQYVFVRHALGEYAGFLVGWSDWISTCGSAAAVAMVMAEYITELVLPLAGRVTVIAAAAVIAFAVLQWRGVKWGDGAQQLTSLIKTLVLVALVAACFLLPVQSAAPAPAAAAIPHGVALFAAITIALQGVIYTYDGWNGVIYFSEEVRNPGRDIPRAMMLGVVAVIVIYLALNVAFLHVVPIGGMAGQTLVAGTAAGALFGPRGDTIIHIIMVLSLLSSVNALVLMASRVPYALARDRLLPARLTAVNHGGTPTPALVAGLAISLIFIVTGTFDQVLALLAFFFVLNYLLSFTSVFVLRRREPDVPRPYRAWGYPWTTGVALVGSAAFLVSAVIGDRANSVRSIIILGLTWPLFLIIRRVRGPGGAPAEADGA